MAGPESPASRMPDVEDVAPLERMKCSATSKRTGKRCGQWPVPGLAVCKWHGGATAAARAKAERVVAQRELQAVALRLGASVEMDPAQALLEALWSAIGDLQFWQQVSVALELRHGECDGIIGVNHLGDQAVHVAVRELADAQRRVSTISKMCIDANIGERRLQLIEAEAASTFEVIVAALQKLGLDTPEVRVGIAGELRSRALRADAIDVEGTELP